ncbi:MAG: hypothetical protein NVSMB5_06020 [Candidatus Velthaea sp.]
MVMIHAVAARDNREAATAVLGERVEHVVEKFDVGRNVDRAAVQREPQFDLRLFRGAFDDAAALDQLSAPFALLPLEGGAPFTVP